MTKNEKTLLSIIVILIVLVSSFIAYMLYSRAKEVSVLRIYNEKSLIEVEVEDADYETDFDLIKKKYLESVSYLEVMEVHDAIETEILSIKKKGNPIKRDELEYSIRKILKDYFAIWNEESAKKVLTEIYDGYKENDVDYLKHLTSHEGKIKFMIEYEIRFLQGEGLKITE